MKYVEYIVYACHAFLMKKSKRYAYCHAISDYKKRTELHEKISMFKIKQYEKKWRSLTENYREINVYGVEFHAIGETIPRLCNYLYDERKRDKDSYNIVLPTFTFHYRKELGIVNKKIFDIFASSINFIREKDISFWQYIFFVHLKKVNKVVFDLYKHRRAIVYYNEACKPVVSFDECMYKYAQDKMKKMGITKEFICMHARETAGRAKTYPKGGTFGGANTSVASVEINSFKRAAEYLCELGYQTVRMGKDERKKCDFEGTIDYANSYYDEFMDFYLITNCKFLIGSASGLTSITPLFGRPTLITNLNVFAYGFESMAYTKYDMYIPKKIYSGKEKRLLNFYEMIDITNECDRYDDEYEKRNLEVWDNTEEEILDAVIEMNAKMDNTWEITDDEKQCMKKYWDIVELWKNSHKTSKPRERGGAEGYCMAPCPICYSYLKANMYLLEL